MLRAFAVALCVPLFVACGTALPEGRYEGNLRSLAAHGSEPVPIQIDIKKEGRSALHAEVFDKFETKLQTLDLALKHGTQLELTAPSIRRKPFTLFRYATEESPDISYCFETRDGSAVNLCFSEYQFILTVGGPDKAQAFSMTGNLFARVKDAAPHVLEPPKPFVLTQAIESAYDRNFESRAAIEHVMQSKNAAIAAWLNLLPHLSANLIWNADFGYISAIATLQALAPFLLPSHWLNAKASSIEVKVKHDALLLVRANLALSVEQLAYAAERDTQLVLAHTRVIDAVKPLLASLGAQLWSQVDSTGRIAASFGAVQTLLEEVERGRSDIEAVLKDDLFSLAAALGLHNPEGVLSVALDKEEEPIDGSRPIEPAGLAKLATDRSFEADQLEYLRRIAHLKTIELYFTWMDPSGNQKLSLGFNLIGSARVAKSQKAELAAKLEHVKDTVYQDAYRTTQAYNRALRLNARLQREANPADALTKFTAELDGVRLSGGLDLRGAESAVQAYLKQTIEYQSNLANFRIARAKKDRLMLSGYYERLLFRLPTQMFPKKADHYADPRGKPQRPILNIPGNKL